MNAYIIFVMCPGDKRTGEGMFHWANGTRFEGSFNQEKPVDGLLFERDGNVNAFSFVCLSLQGRGCR